jgi:hypothetical protein
MVVPSHGLLVFVQYESASQENDLWTKENASEFNFTSKTFVA